MTQQLNIASFNWWTKTKYR